MSDSPQSPPKDVEQAAHSGDEEAMNDNQDPHGLAGYEFEGVKEQDRWLPIANGRSLPSPRSCLVICSSLRHQHSPAYNGSRFVQGLAWLPSLAWAFAILIKGRQV